MFSTRDIAEIEAVAAASGLDAAALRAVAEIESGGRAMAQFEGGPVPLIRWEGHYFHRRLSAEELAKALAAPALASPHAFPHPDCVRNPPDQTRRHRMLARARRINERAAIESCSWGVGQVMGANWEWLGFESAQEFEARAREGLAGQVELMARFIARAGLADELSRRDWAGFARAYNGPAYHANRYDKRLAEAFARLAGDEAPGELNRIEYALSGETLRLGARGPAVSALQRSLNCFGYALRLDGDFGPATKRAVRLFQSEYGLDVDGVAGARTLALLDALKGDRPARI